MPFSSSSSSSSLSLEERSKIYIPAEIRLFSACQDIQTSADVSNVKQQFQLPTTTGAGSAKQQAGGAFTASLLQVLYEDYNKNTTNQGKGNDTTSNLTLQQILIQLRKILKVKGYTQIPQLSSSRCISMKQQFSILPSTTSQFKGTRRAVMIGINYIGMKGIELSGCHNDIHNMITYLKTVHGFQNEHITILMDDGKHILPTKKAILYALKTLVSQCQAGDAVFCHFAGHGSKTKDLDGDEDDGYDETFIPIDYKTSGMIVDDEIFDILIHPMPANVLMTCIIDCCHSGTILDLPFSCIATEEDNDSNNNSMTVNDKFQFGHWDKIQAQRRKKQYQKLLTNYGWMIVPILVAIVTVPMIYVWQEQQRTTALS